MKTLKDQLNESLNEAYDDVFIPISNVDDHLFELSDEEISQISKSLKVPTSKVKLIKYDLDEISSDLSQDFHDLLTRNSKTKSKSKIDDKTIEVVTVDDGKIKFDAAFIDVDGDFTIVAVKDADIKKIIKDLESYEGK